MGKQKDKAEAGLHSTDSVQENCTDVLTAELRETLLTAGTEHLLVISLLSAVAPVSSFVNFTRD